MIRKRIVAHILNKLIIFFPSTLFLGGISLLVFPDYFILGNDPSSGWLIFWLLKYLIFLPTVFLDLISRPSEFLQVIYIILPALINIIFIETIGIHLMGANIGMKIMGLEIVSTKARPLKLGQILLRTGIKYFTLAFFPFLLIYIFMNKEKISIHDKIANTRVVKGERSHS